MGDAGGFLRHSSGRSGARPSPAVLGWGVVDGAITLYDGSKRPGEEEVIQGGVVAGARLPEFTVQNHGSESRRSPGQRLGGERSPGSPTIRVVHRFSLLSFQPGRASALSPSSLVALVLRAGFLKKNFYFFQKGYWATGITYFSVFVLIIRIYNQTIFRTKLK